MEPELVSRARGALLALVAGNQLGVPTEYLGTPEAIRKQFPAGVTDLAPPPKNSPYDDDAAMALLFGESLLAARGFDAADLARRWVKWMKVDGRGIGNTTKRALTLIDRGKEPFEAGRLVYQENPRFSAGNGSVMRCVPAALRYHDDLDRLIRIIHVFMHRAGSHRFVPIRLPLLETNDRDLSICGHRLQITAGQRNQRPVAIVTMQGGLCVRRDDAFPRRRTVVLELWHALHLGARLR